MVVNKKEDSDRQRFIEKGGSVVASTKHESEWTTICLRIPKQMLANIDVLVKEKPGFTRTTWILQTFQEKLIS
jgi:hypothetical protein